MKNEHLQIITELVEAVSSQTHAFPVAFEYHETGFDPFEQKYKICLFCGDGRGKVSSLHEQLYAGEHRAERSSTHPFRPHMTIATYDERTQIERVDVSDVGQLPVRANLHALEIVQLSNGALLTLRTVPFRG